MALQFRSGKSSAKFAQTLLEPVAHEHSIALGDPQQWRANYQRVFALLTAIEALDSGAGVQRRLLQSLHGQIAEPNGPSLHEIVASGFAAGRLDACLEIASINGSGQPSALATIGKPTAERLIAQELAEPALALDLEAFDQLEPGSGAGAEIANTVFIAIGANAELALTEELLSLGATVIAVARPNPAKWQRLCEFAASSAGTLIYPQIEGKPGLSLDTQTELVANWLAQVVRDQIGKRIVCLGFVYAPGSAQIIASAAQDALMAALADQVGASRFVAGWLATPLDSYCVDRSVLESQLAQFARRTLATRLRDALLELSAARAKAANRGAGVAAQLSSELDSQGRVVIDYSANRQGSSYLLAKRIEGWRAAELASRGFETWFQITPAAQTNSTLGYKFVRAAYRGLARLGVVTFEAWMLRDLLTAALLGRLARLSAGERASAHPEDSAIHGKLWRMPYRLERFWVASFLAGLDEFLRR